MPAEMMIEMGEGRGEVFAVLQEIGRASAEQQAKHDKSDARRALAGMLGNTLHSYWLTLNILATHHVPPGEDNRYIELLKFLRGSVLVGFFSGLENGVRSIWAHLRGGIYDTNTFDGVVRGLLKRLNLTDHQTLLDLTRTARNAVHNGYVYRGPDKQVEWEGTKYEFKDGQPVELFSAGTLHRLLAGLWKVAADILGAPEVRGLAFVNLGGWTEGGAWTAHESSKNGAG